MPWDSFCKRAKRKDKFFSYSLAELCRFVLAIFAFSWKLAVILLEYKKYRQVFFSLFNATCRHDNQWAGWETSEEKERRETKKKHTHWPWRTEEHSWRLARGGKNTEINQKTTFSEKFSKNWGVKNVKNHKIYFQKKTQKYLNFISKILNLKHFAH